MVRAHAQLQTAVQHGEVLDVGLAVAPSAEGDVERLVVQALREVVRERLVRLDANLVADVLAIGFEQRGQVVVLHGERSAQAHGAAQLRFSAVHRVDAVVEGAQAVAHVAVELAAVRRQLDAAPIAAEQRDAQLLLQRADRVGERRLGDVELFRRARVVLQLGELLEVVELGQVHSDAPPRSRPVEEDARRGLAAASPRSSRRAVLAEYRAYSVHWLLNFLAFANV